MMGYELHDLVGNLGVLCILSTYLLLQLGKLSAEHLGYSAVNGLGAALVLYSLTVNFNLSAFVIEFAWLLISIYGFFRHYFNAKMT